MTKYTHEHGMFHWKEEKAVPHVETGPEPSVDEIQQYPIDKVPPVYVCVEGIANVRVMPAKRGQQQTIVVPVTPLTIQNQPAVAVNADPRIRRVWFASTGAVVIGTLEQVASKNGPYGFTLNSTTPTVWEGIHEDLYVVATAGTPSLSVRIEYWAD